MVIRRASASDQEPEESNFKLPSEREHLLQVVDCIEDENDTDIQTVKLEVVGGDEEGLSFLQRININDKEKSFYYCRMFLKAIGEPYKGEFDIYPDNWIGRQMYANIIHNKGKNGKTYANLYTYNFDKKVEQFDAPKPKKSGEDIAWEE